MKKLLKFVLPVVIFTFLFSGCATNRAISQGSSGDITYQTFYNDLSPYGTWIDYPGYGNVWNPSGIADFTPYSSNGYWVYSNAGWSWNSGYSWGWAPFHYGRWFYDDNYGWLWVPGYDWSPAWVTWGTFGMIIVGLHCCPMSMLACNSVHGERPDFIGIFVPAITFTTGTFPVLFNAEVHTSMM